MGLTRISPPADVVDKQRPPEHDQTCLEDPRGIPPPHLRDLGDRDREEGGRSSWWVAAGGEAGDPGQDGFASFEEAA